MKRKEGFILRQMGSQYVAVAVGEVSKEFNGLVRMNGSGAFLWECLAENQSNEQLIQALMEKYEIEEEEATDGVEIFLTEIRKAGLLYE